MTLLYFSQISSTKSFWRSLFFCSFSNEPVLLNTLMFISFKVLKNHALFKSILRILLIQKTRLKFSWNRQELIEKTLKFEISVNSMSIPKRLFVFHEFLLQFLIEREKRVMANIKGPQTVAFFIRKKCHL
jgi:hypothetical protein